MSGALEALTKTSKSANDMEDASEEEDYISELTKNGPVELRVYGHQVGGHSLLMKFGKAVCKPMIPRERFFYTSIPREIREFTPAYYGIANIGFRQTEDGMIHFLAIPPSSVDGEKQNEGLANGHSRGFENLAPVEGAGGEGVVGEVEALALSHPIVRLDFFKATNGLGNHKSEDRVKETNGVFSNPWSSACMDNVQTTLSHYGATQLQDMFQDYVVLEDLTCKFEHPCILDLKMGTRQHGDDQSEEKKRKHTERCATSTSARLGVRISGMQMYNASECVYRFKDKYYGRELSPDGFHGALRDFLWNGKHLRTDIVPTLIGMLMQLREMIKSHDSFRFFSSSLLIMYDGRAPADATEDSAPNSKSHSSSVERECTCASGECVMCGGVTTEDGGGANGHNQVSGTDSDNSTNHRYLHASHLHMSSLEGARKVVDVRMIDFAHTTHKRCEKDAVKYSGPDEGYILGLSTLISAFGEIANL